MLPHATITKIPDDEPEATPELWNTRYDEIDENFAALEEIANTGGSAVANHLGSANPHPQYVYAQELASAIALNARGFWNLVMNGTCRQARFGASQLNYVGMFVYGGAERIACGVFDCLTVSGTVNRSSFDKTISKSGYAQQITCTTTGTGGKVMFSVRNVGRHVAHVAGKPVTASAVMYQESGVPINARIAWRKPAGTIVDYFHDGVTACTLSSGSPISNPVSVPNGIPTLISSTVTLTQADVENGLEILFYFEGVPPVTSTNFKLGDLQLVEGNSVTEIEIPPEQYEVAQCNDYKRWVPRGLFVKAISSSSVILPLIIDPPMRSYPSFDLVHNGLFADSIYISGSPNEDFAQIGGWSIQASNFSKDSLLVRLDYFSGLTAGNMYYLNHLYGSQILLSAEL